MWNPNFDSPRFKQVWISTFEFPRSFLASIDRKSQGNLFPRGRFRSYRKWLSPAEFAGADDSGVRLADHLGWEKFCWRSLHRAITIVLYIQSPCRRQALQGSEINRRTEGERDTEIEWGEKRELIGSVVKIISLLVKRRDGKVVSCTNIKM